MGSINLHASAVDAFTDRDAAVAAVFASHAAVAMRSSRTKEQLREALASRDVIGRAKGILMASRGLTDDEAFEALREASQRLNRKVCDLADEVNFTGEIPEVP